MDLNTNLEDYPKRFKMACEKSREKESGLVVLGQA